MNLPNNSSLNDIRSKARVLKESIESLTSKISQGLTYEEGEIPEQTTEELFAELDIKNEEYAEYMDLIAQANQMKVDGYPFTINQALFRLNRAQALSKGLCGRFPQQKRRKSTGYGNVAIVSVANVDMVWAENKRQSLREEVALLQNQINAMNFAIVFKTEPTVETPSN